MKYPRIVVTIDQMDVLSKVEVDGAILPTWGIEIVSGGPQRDQESYVQLRLPTVLCEVIVRGEPLRVKR